MEGQEAVEGVRCKARHPPSSERGKLAYGTVPPNIICEYLPELDPFPTVVALFTPHPGICSGPCARNDSVADLCIFKMPSLEEPLEERLSFDFKNLPQHTPPLFVVGFQLWQIILLAATTIVVLVGLKRRYFSSISDVPGPFLATASGNLWHSRYTFQGHLENEAIALHKKHGSRSAAWHLSCCRRGHVVKALNFQILFSGPFVRIGHNEVGIGHRDAVEQLLLARIRKVRA